MTKIRCEVAAEDRAAFMRDGAVCIRGLFSAAELAGAAEGVERNLSAPSPSAKIASTAADP